MAKYTTTQKIGALLVTLGFGYILFLLLSYGISSSTYLQ